MVALKKQPRSAGTDDGRRLLELGVHFGFKREGTSGRKMRSCMSPRHGRITLVETVPMTNTRSVAGYAC